MFSRLVPLFTAAVLAVFAMTACTAQQEQDSPAPHHTSLDVPATEVPVNDSATGDYFSPTYDFPGECSLEGSVTEGEVETAIDGHVVVAYGNVEVQRPDDIWAETTYTLTIDWLLERRSLTLYLTSSRDDFADDVAAGFEWLDYPDADGKLWTEYQHSGSKSDGTGGTLEARFSYRHDPDMAQVSVDLLFVCEDDDSSLG